MARAFLGRALGLLFQFHAFQSQQVLRTLDRILQGAVGVVEQGTLFQAPLLLALVRSRVQVGMQLAAQFVELPLQASDI